MHASKHQCANMRARSNISRGVVAVQPSRSVRGLPPSLFRTARSTLLCTASATAPAPLGNSNSSDEGSRLAFSPLMSVPHVTMAGGGSFGSATLERRGPSFVMPSPVVKGPKLDDGGDGGDIGKNNRNGGGGDGGGNDDDDWFGEEDGDGEGEGGEGQRSGLGLFRAAAIPESFDKLSLAAVFAEWMKTLQDLPAILRQAVQLGLFSSAQLVRFFAMDVRPGVTRSISRHLPPSAARDFVGRLMADPGFVQKLVLESSFAALASLWYEMRARGDNFKNEIDLALINTIGMAAATGATVWLLAPSRSYGSLQKLPWQQMLDGLPNCVFDVSGPLRQFSKRARAAGFLAKAAELSAVGAITGTAMSLLSGAAVAVKKRLEPEWQPSFAVPSAGRSSGGLAAFFALNANVRYQVLGGLDRLLFDRTTFLWTYMALSGAARLASNQVGELSRAWWQGLPSPSTLSAPAFLAPSRLPTIRRVKKKVSKRVPRSVLFQQQQQRQQQQQVASMASAAAVVGAEQQSSSSSAATLLLEPLRQADAMAAREQVAQGSGGVEQAAVELQAPVAVAYEVQSAPVAQAQRAHLAQGQHKQQGVPQQQQQLEQSSEGEESGSSEEATQVSARRAAYA